MDFPTAAAESRQDETPADDIAFDDIRTTADTHTQDSIRRKFRVGTIMMAIAAALFAGVGIAMISIIESSHHETEIAAIALRNHVEGDMMHDAIRSSVLKAQLAAINDDRSAMLEAKDDLKRYGDWFERLVRANKLLDLPDATKKLLDEVDEPLATYLADALEVQALLSFGSDRTDQQLVAFEREFDQLEEAMLKVSNGLEKSMRDARENNETMVLLAISTMTVLALLMLAVIFWFYRSVIRDVVAPIEGQTQSLFALSRGDHNVEIAGLERRDEIGQLASGIAAFKGAVRTALDANIAQSRAEKQAVDATNLAESEGARRDRMRELSETIEQRVLVAAENLVGKVNSLLSLSSNIAQSADQTKTEIMNASATGAQIVENMNQVASASGQLAVSAANIGRVVKTSVDATVAAAERGNSAASQSSDLLQSVNEIRDFSRLIGDISKQTGQLALNARIEASRAGDAGTSFAVVANEIKDLSSDASGAATTISAKVATIRDVGEAVTGSIAGFNESVQKLRDASAVVGDAIDEQNLATESIDMNIREVAAGTRNMSAMVGSIEAIAISSASDAVELKEIAATLGTLATDLRNDVVAIVADVKAA
jgi:methyl-accepting chemotaxis protein